MPAQDETDDQILIELNMDHPFNKWMAEKTVGMDVEQFRRFMFKIQRRRVVTVSLQKIGNVSAFRRKLIVRALLSAFRDGYHAGHQDGYQRCEERMEAEGK